MNPTDTPNMVTRSAQPQHHAPGKLYWEPTAEEEAGVNSLPSQAQRSLKLAPSSFNQRVVDYYADSPLAWD